MTDLAIRLMRDAVGQGLAWTVALIYVAIFLVAVGDFTIDDVSRSVSAFAAASWEGLVFRQRAPFQFEAVAVIEAPFLVWLVSPMNIAVGATLGLLTGVQIALVRVARRCSLACGLSPATGILAGLPGLLAGSACCAPILFVLLGLQVTASMVTIMGLMIPAAFLLLAIGLALTLRVAMRRCVEAYA
jgi:hypothetical protein